MFKIIFSFQYHKGIIKSESKFVDMNMLKHVLNFVESAAALNEFLYFFA